MGLPSLAGVEALVHIHPVVRGLPIASFHCRVGFAPALCLAAALLDGTVKCPESLCPMSVFPHWGDVYAVSCEDITPRSMSEIDSMTMSAPRPSRVGGAKANQQAREKGAER